MRVIVEEACKGGNEGVSTSILSEDAVKHARGTILDDVGVVVAMGRRHMVTVRVHPEVVSSGDRLRSMCFMVVSTHLTTAAKDTALTQRAIRLLILAGEVSIDGVGSVPVKSIRSSVVRDRVQVVERRGTCNGRREHCTDIVRARPVTRCSPEKWIKNVHAIIYVTLQERVAGGGNLSKQVFHVGDSIKDGAVLCEYTTTEGSQGADNRSP